MSRKPHTDPHGLYIVKKNAPLDDLEPGEVVAYTAAFCRQLGMTGGERRGCYVGPHPEVKDWALVRWDGDSEDTPVSRVVLARPGPNLRFAEAR